MYQFCLQFVKFANIEEDTPSYHRRYDFFVSKFSAMCHSGDSTEMRNKIRIAGIRGLQAVVRKTVSDELVENIWEPVHMDKIVPSLLFNMQESGFHMKEGSCVEPAPEEQVDPPMLAETCLRELVGRASFGHIRAVLRPVLRYNVVLCSFYLFLYGYRCLLVTYIIFTQLKPRGSFRNKTEYICNKLVRLNLKEI